MPKTAKKQAIACNEHEFELTPLRGDLYFKQPVTLSFCKAKQDPKSKTGNKRSKGGKNNCLCCPIFNKDHNYATTTFILPEQKKNYIENQMNFKIEHECRIKEYSDQKSQLLVPKPKSKQSYCNVCRNNYDDYLSHIKSEFHKVSIRRAVFSKHIKDLEGKYDKINQGRNSQSKNCYNTDTTQNASQSQQQIQMMGMPTKRVKRDMNFTPAFCYPIGMNTFPDFNSIDIGQRKKVPMASLAFFAYEIYQMRNQSTNGYCQPFPTMNQNDIFQLMPTINSLPVSQEALNYNQAMLYNFTMMFSNSMQSFPQVPSTYIGTVFPAEIPKIQANFQ